MRTARIIGAGASYYHCMSRIIQGQMLLKDSEKERFRKIVRAIAAFAGVAAVNIVCSVKCNGTIQKWWFSAFN